METAQNSLNFLIEILKQTFRTDEFMVVLIVAAALMGIIAIALVYIAAKLKKIAEKPAEAAAQQPIQPVAAMPMAVTPVANSTGKNELVAVIAAAIAETMGEDVSRIQIHSIRKI